MGSEYCETCGSSDNTKVRHGNICCTQCALISDKHDSYKNIINKTKKYLDEIGVSEEKSIPILELLASAAHI